jgi:hypothetical protein
LDIGNPDSDDVGTGGTGGTGTGGTGTGGIATGGIATGGIATGGIATGGIATGGIATGGTGTGGTTGPMIISIRFVGGRTGGSPGTVAMDAAEVAGVRPAARWNSAESNAGTLSSLLASDGTTTSASAAWNAPVATGEASATWTVPFADNNGNAHMMNGYLDPRANASPARIDMTLPTSISGAYDVYVYCYANIDARTRTYKYTIGATTRSVTQTGPSPTTFPGFTEAPEAGAGDYVVFRNLSGTSFTLWATPPVVPSGSTRAPVNGLQIVFPSGS